MWAFDIFTYYNPYQFLSYLKELQNGLEMDLKSSHQTGKTFHKSYNNDIQFALYFSYSF